MTARRLAGLACALALLCGCGGPAAPAEEPAETPDDAAVETPEEDLSAGLTLPYQPASSLDPYAGAEQVNQTVASLLYEPLYQVDASFTAQPVLAQSLSGEDGVHYALTLRGDALFSDGSAVTAADVVYSIGRARTSSVYAGRLANLSSARAAGEGVELTFSVPVGEPALLLDFPILSSRAGAAGLPLGSGPYVPAQAGETLSLVKNTHWRGDGVPYDTVSLYPVTGTDTLISGFSSGEITLLSTDLNSADALGYAGNYDTWDMPTSVFLYLGCNTQSGPCREAALRAALNRGCNREGLAAVQLSHHARAASLPCSPASALYNENLAQETAFDQAALADGLAAAGWKQGENGWYRGRTALSLTLLVNAGSAAKVAMANRLADDFAAQGVAVEVEALGWEDYNAALAAGSFDLYLGEVKLTADFDLTPLVSTGGSLNYGQYTNPETDSALAAYLAAGSNRPQAAAALYRQLAKEAPILPLCFKNYSVLTRWGTVDHLSPTQQNIFYDLSGWTTD